ncbi:hypothetical protein J6590_041003 [Homalodisca vitripennis]|nr:hypothetical protein J6590_041003 [Homalodisca vitripennis]
MSLSFGTFPDVFKAGNHWLTSEPPPTAGQAGFLQGQDRSAVTHRSSSHARCCLIRLSCDNHCTRIHYAIGDLVLML